MRDGRDLRPGLLGAATRGAHDREPDRGADRAGEERSTSRCRRRGSSKTRAIAGPRSNGQGWSACAIWRPKDRSRLVLVYSPDRLSRKYAYQILLIEELARHGVETRFLNAPQGATAEDQLLVQFQGMIAEYERAQILERSRRGKRHRARAGEISVLSGAPYGYRYLRKT